MKWSYYFGQIATMCNSVNCNQVQENALEFRHWVPFIPLFLLIDEGLTFESNKDVDIDYF